MNITNMMAKILELKTVMSKNLMKPRTYSNVLSSTRSKDSEEVSDSRSRNHIKSSALSKRAAEKRSRKNSSGEGICADSAIVLASNTFELVRPPSRDRIKPTFGTGRSDSSFHFASVRPPALRNLHWMLEL